MEFSYNKTITLSASDKIKESIITDLVGKIDSDSFPFNQAFKSQFNVVKDNGLNVDLSTLIPETISTPEIVGISISAFYIDTNSASIPLKFILKNNNTLIGKFSEFNALNIEDNNLVLNVSGIEVPAETNGVLVILILTKEDDTTTTTTTT